MRGKKKKESSTKKIVQATGISEIKQGETISFLVGLLILAFSLYMVLAFFSNITTGGEDQSFVENNFQDNIKSVHNYAGALGARISYYFMQKCFGFSSFFIPVFMAVLSMKLMRAYRIRLWKWFLNCSVLMIWSSIALSFFSTLSIRNLFSFYPGGMHGEYMCNTLSVQIGKTGVFLVLLFMAVIYFVYITNETMTFFRKVFRPQKAIITVKKGWENRRKMDSCHKDQNEEIFVPEKIKEEEQTLDESVQNEDIVIDIPEESQENIIQEQSETILSFNRSNETQKAEGNTVEEKDLYDPTKDLENYHFPTLDLLQKYETNSLSIDMEEQNANKERIIKILKDFDVEISSIRATIGPTITLYEITPAPGVRISKIKNLEDDIALSLSAMGIRIIAPIPGKGTIGIEVPNKHPQIVSMESILNSKKFQETKMTLPMALGKTITNEPYIVDLAQLPHLLVAGSTGTGKSVGLNAIITSLLYKKHPSELKLVMVDPKKVELSIYSSIEKHFLAKIPNAPEAIITDVKKVSQTLKSLCVEMDERYGLLQKAHVRKISEYNEKFKRRELNPENGHRFMPYIVLIVDEFADLIMVAGSKEIEPPITRLGQLARAVGIHMIIATQRPTANIINGTIKTNFPARMAFKVMSSIDSHTILDRSGAQQLVGKGDMLFFSKNDPVRVQCAFVDTPEVEKITDYISRQQGYSSAFELPEVAETEDGSAVENDVDTNHLDPMFKQAARLIVIHQQGSTSLIQRKFSIGYNRAGRIMDQLEKVGIVGPAQGGKPRDVLCPDEISLDNLINEL